MNTYIVFKIKHVMKTSRKQQHIESVSSEILDMLYFSLHTILYFFQKMVTKAECFNFLKTFANQNGIKRNKCYFKKNTDGFFSLGELDIMSKKEACLGLTDIIQRLNCRVSSPSKL